MEKLSMKDVSKRRRALEKKVKKKDLSILLNKDKLTLKEAQEVIKNFESIDENQVYAFEKVLDIFKEGYSNGYTCKNDLELSRLCDSICEIMPRLETTSNPVHDLIMKQSRESRNFFKRSMRNSKKYMDRAVNPLDGSISSKDYNNHTKDIEDIPVKNYQKKTLKDAPTKDTFSPAVSPAKTEECFMRIQEVAKNIRAYDRVLYNHNKLCKRFNLNEVVENSKDFEMCVYELCELLDSYDLPFDIKYNVALENINYLFELNHKYDDRNPKEYIDEFFYTRDLSDQNRMFMESITQENRFYYQELDPVTEKTNELDLIVEASKSNPVKDAVEEFKKSNEKTIPMAKRLVNKIYTKSPQQIIDGTPNFLHWFRTFLMLSIFSVQPLLGIIALFTDKLVELHLKRKEITRVLKMYDSEIKQVEKKIEKTNNQKTKDRLIKYHDELKVQYTILKDYADGLKTERELNDEDEINEYCLAEGVFDKITIGDELDRAKVVIRFEFKKVLERLKIASNNKFKSYFDNGIFSFIPEDEIEDFLSTFDSELGRYIDAAGNICMSFCKCDINKLFKKDDDRDVFQILDDLCTFCKTGCCDKVDIGYEGTGGTMYLIFTYLEPLYIEADLRDEIRQSCFHPMTFDSINTIEEVSLMMDIMNEYPMDEFKNTLLESEFDLEDTKSLIDYLSSSSLFSIDETTDILMHIREKASGIYKENIIYNIDKFIRESVNLEDPEFDLGRFVEDVEQYAAVSEELKIGKKFNKNKFNKKKEDLKKNVSNKMSNAALTAKLGASAAKGAARKLDAKQQDLSRNLDNSVSALAKRIEQASISKNREQIIKGSILPSASRIIKTAVGLGTAWAINPAIAVVGALGMLFVGKNATRKERALILDELDIELKIVEKKIAKAESDDDVNKLRELYKIQNKLRREKQRLKYKMAVYYHQKPIGTGREED